MILKQKIDVAGQDIFIKFRKNLIVEDRDEKGIMKRDKCDGAFIPDTNTIYIDANLVDKTTKLGEVFFHELLECIITLLEIDIHYHPWITQIGVMMYAVLRRHKIIKPINFKLIPIEEDLGPV